MTKLTRILQDHGTRFHYMMPLEESLYQYAKALEKERDEWKARSDAFEDKYKDMEELKWVVHHRAMRLQQELDKLKNND